MNKTRIATALALACLSSLALAQARAGADAGWYVGANVGRANGDINSTDWPSGGGAGARSVDDHHTGWKVLLGYNFDQNWAFEGYYTNLGTPKVRYTNLTTNTRVPALTGQTGEFRVDNDAWGLALKGTAPVHQQWDLYGRVGYSYNRSKLDATFSVADDWIGNGNVQTAGWSANNSRHEVMFGVGTEFKPQRNWGIRLEYENYGNFGKRLDNYSNTGRTQADFWSAGLVVRF